MYVNEEDKGSAEMDELKEQLKRDARRHANKLIKKLSQVLDLPDLATDSIHQEFLYATMDGYRTTMKITRNGDMKHDAEETNGNY